MKRVLLLVCLALAAPVALFAAKTSLQSAGGELNPAVAEKQPTSVPRAYRVIVDRNIFGFAPRKEKTEPKTATATTSVPVPPQSEIVPMFSDSTNNNPSISTLPLLEQTGIAQRYALTGIIEINSECRAIIENKQDGTGGYYAEGDSLQGYMIIVIERDRVILDNGFEQVTLMHPSAGITGYAAPPAAPRGNSAGPAAPPDLERLPAHIRQRIGR